MDHGRPRRRVDPFRARSQGQKLSNFSRARRRRAQGDVPSRSPTNWPTADSCARGALAASSIWLVQHGAVGHGLQRLRVRPIALARAKQRNLLVRARYLGGGRARGAALVADGCQLLLQPHALLVVHLGLELQFVRVRVGGGEGSLTRAHVPRGERGAQLDDLELEAAPGVDLVSEGRAHAVGACPVQARVCERRVLALAERWSPTASKESTGCHRPRCVFARCWPAQRTAQR
jgi:hypothetical protein